MVQGNILHHNKQHKKEKTGLGPPYMRKLCRIFFRSGKQTLPSGTKRAIRDHQKYPLHAEAMPNFFRSGKQTLPSETKKPIRDHQKHPPTCGSYAEFFFGPENKPSHPGPKGPSGTTRSTSYMRKLCRIFVCLGQPLDQLAHQ